MPLSTAVKSKISLAILFVIAGYILNYMILRPIVLTSDTTSTYYLDSIKVSAAVTGGLCLFISSIGLALGWYLLTY
ncbi:hypothetical protein X943_003104 [Babesia divergens]|uniref:Uncharacterized protein n=1 Tax=Babesia divergens TaxID=32595 RepID=A0AAD9GKV0_BABDI|nr:hypothetical protein X943_003104 [Babesia divergens]